MSDQETKEKHSRRLYDDEVHVKKRTNILKELHSSLDDKTKKQPHRLHKISGMNCGNPKCVMCGNPRKVFGEKTIQEKKFDEINYD